MHFTRSHNTLLDKLDTKFDSKIIIIVPHYTYLDNYESYINAIIEVAKFNGIDFVDLYHNSGISKDNYKCYTTDGVHLNKDGYALIAMSIGQSMIDILY